MKPVVPSLLETMHVLFDFKCPVVSSFWSRRSAEDSLVINNCETRCDIEKKLTV
jgi:hypothetical protein